MHVAETVIVECRPPFGITSPLSEGQQAEGCHVGREGDRDHGARQQHEDGLLLLLLVVVVVVVVVVVLLVSLVLSLVIVLLL